MNRTSLYNISCILLVLCLVIQLCFAGITVGKDNTFVEGSRTTITFDFPYDLYPETISQFPIYAGSFDKNSPVALSMPGMTGTKHSWPIFTDVHLWGHNEPECWVKDDPKTNIGSFTYNKEHFEDFFISELFTEPFMMNFQTNRDIKSGTVIICYLQTISGSYMDSIRVHETTVKVIHDATKVVIQDLQQGPTYPLLQLPIILTNTQPYTVHSVGIYDYMDFKKKTSNNGNIDKTTINPLNTTINDDNDDISDVSETGGGLDIEQTVMMFPRKHSPRVWSEYKSPWVCKDNKARIYIFPVPEEDHNDGDIYSSSPYGNLQYLILVSDTVTPKDTIECALPLHIEDLLTNIAFNQSDFMEKNFDMTLIKTEDTLKHPIQHKISSIAVVGRTINYNMKTKQKYYNIDKLLAVAASGDSVIACRTGENDHINKSDYNDDGNITFTCAFQSPHRLEKISLLNPLDHINNTKFTSLLSKYSTHYNPKIDLNDIIIPLTEGVTFKDGEFLFDITEWESDIHLVEPEYTFSFKYNHMGTKYENKFLVSIASLDFRYITATDDTATTFDKTRKGHFDITHFFTLPLSFNHETQYTIKPNKHILDISVSLAQPYYIDSMVSSTSGVPVIVSPLDPNNAHTLLRIVDNVKNDIKCTLHIGKTKSIDMVYTTGLKIPLWKAVVQDSVFSSSSNNEINIQCTINISIVDYYRPENVLLSLFDLSVPGRGDITYIQDDKDIRSALYKPVAILHNVYTDTYPTHTAVLTAFQTMLSHTPMDKQCQAILGNLTLDQIAVVDIRQVSNTDRYSPIPGHSSTDIHGSRYASTLLVKEGLTVYDKLPIGCPPSEVEIIIYGSDNTHSLNFDQWYDPIRITKSDLYAPKLGYGDKCTNGYQCKQYYDGGVTCSHIDGTCDVLIVPAWTDAPQGQHQHQPFYTVILN